MTALGGFVGSVAAVKILLFDKVRLSLTRFDRRRARPYWRLVNYLLHAQWRVNHLLTLIHTTNSYSYFVDRLSARIRRARYR
jgi:hypothetical protein